MDISQNASIVSAKGGAIEYVTEAGEVLLAVAVPAGVVPVRQYLDLCPDGAQVVLSDGLVVLEPRSGYGAIPYGEGAFDSGANPDYQPSDADRMQREMRLTLSRMQQATRRMEARAEALELVERIPTAPEPEESRQGDLPPPDGAPAE